MISITTDDQQTAIIPMFAASCIPTIRELTEAAIANKADSIRAKGVGTKDAMLAISRFAAYYHRHPYPSIEAPIKTHVFEEIVPEWYVNYVNGLDNETLGHVLFASTSIKYKPLEELICTKIATVLKAMPPDQMHLFCDQVRMGADETDTDDDNETQDESATVKETASGASKQPADEQE